MAFTVTPAGRDGDVLRLRLAGELDLSVAGELTAELDRLQSAGERRLLLDLAGVTFCDSTGIAAFVRGDNRAAVDGGWLRLTGAVGRVDRVLRLTGVADVLGHPAAATDPARPVSG
ncbi:STAS domain-containing protein [Micromonospora sp. NPDC000089]|uniref:STAS domain-containing protein n=1 Tax=unclassified Micromonospora TaxID=2617518 RepID=UPI00369EB7F5